MLVVLIFNHTTFSQWFKCLAWPLFFQASYLLIRSNEGLIKSLRKVFFVLTLMGSVYFFFSLIYKDFESQTNMVYFALLTFPVLLLTPKKRQRYLLLILATLFAFISMKRSMILAFVLFWGFVELKYMLGKGRKGLAVVVTAVMVIAMYGSFSVADDLTGGHLSERLNGEDARDGDITNGREDIYLVTIEMIKQSSLAHIILGNGHNGVRRDSPLEISAHNEFLEIIYDYGVIILLVYLRLWVYVLRQWYFHYRNNTVFFLPYTMSVCIFAVMAMVSQLVLYCSYFLYLVMFWGIVAALKDGQARVTRMPKG
ncbi:MAG: O-antigen ligase family protein [Prevotella sp.]|nr:O-antigen ligase family protein [Prevotella sp.]